MKWNDFLNPRSMLTPGLAGSAVMLISNTMWVEFLIPAKWTALILSFVIIIPILISFSANFFEKIIYFFFNGLIVFSLAINTNFAGKRIQEITYQHKQNVTAQYYYETIKFSLDAMNQNGSQHTKMNQNNLLLLAENNPPSEGAQQDNKMDNKKSKMEKRNWGGNSSKKKWYKKSTKNQEKAFFHPWF